ncbi:MAG: hypothetical protein M1828_003674 [Chrysothrix sp. TS-e1954]|nr:MAG: hypothetical protein M1828_003674 [Chrysothrix sp. TS-e1954]
MSGTTFTLLYFATAASFTKKKSELFPAPSNPEKLFASLEERYPGIKSKVLDSCALTVNLDYVDTDSKGQGNIKAGDEVAIIPPVSAG